LEVPLLRPSMCDFAPRDRIAQRAYSTIGNDEVSLELYN